MPLLKPSLQKPVRDALAGLTGPVRILVFTTDEEKTACEVCDDTRQLVEELACLSDGRIVAESSAVSLSLQLRRPVQHHLDAGRGRVRLGGGCWDDGDEAAVGQDVVEARQRDPRGRPRAARAD